jgi:hypothetical protein
MRETRRGLRLVGLFVIFDPPRERRLKCHQPLIAQGV